MPFVPTHLEHEPARIELDRFPGPLLVEFGASWCPYCQAIQPFLEKLFVDHPQVEHLKIADGKGRRLGRSFGVKLWPNLVFMLAGRVRTQLARPTDAEIASAFQDLVVAAAEAPALSPSPAADLNPGKPGQAPEPRVSGLSSGLDRVAGPGSPSCLG